MRSHGESTRRTGLLVLLVAFSLVLQACSINLDTIMQAAGGLLVGLSQQVSNPTLRGLLQAAGAALGQSSQNFDQFLQTFAGSLATNMAGGVLPPGMGPAIGTGTGTGYPGNPTNLSPTNLSADGKAVLAALQSTGVQLSAQIPKEQIRSAAQKVLALVPAQYRQAVDRVTDEVYGWLQSQSGRQTGPSGGQSTSPQGPISTVPGGTAPTSGYPAGGQQQPQAPSGTGSITIGGQYGGVGGSVTIPLGGK